MIVILLVLQCITCISSLYQDNFIKGFYHQDSIIGIEDPEHQPNLAPYACSGFCMNQSSCGAFTVQSKLSCVYLEESDVPKLVKSSKVGSKSREVWVKESLLGELTPHMLVIAGSGKLQDVSFDADKSPPIEYGIEVPNESPKPGPFAVNHDLSMVMAKPGDSYFLSWNFDDQTPSTIPDSTVPVSLFRSGSATQNGRLFFSRQTKTYTMVNNKLKELANFPLMTISGCATFVPGDDDSVYLIGGFNQDTQKFIKTIHRYQFSTNEFTDLEKDMPVNGGIKLHSCVGVEATNGDKIVVVIGGHVGIDSDQNEGYTDTVRTFNVETKQWGLWPSYALPSVLHRSIFANGFIYTAGGKDSDDAYIQKIFKMEPSAEGSWEEFAELDLEETESPYLIMYNN